MHEFTLAQDILRIVEESAAAHELHSVAEVQLTVGQLAGVNIDALNFGWDFARRSSPIAQHAELVMESVAGQACCAACGHQEPVADLLRICPACGALALRFTSGEEFMVTGLSGETQAQEVS